MASRTNEQWAELVAAIEKEVEARLQTSQPGSSASTLDNFGIAQLIDHTLLKLDATEAQITDLCTEASRYNFKTVCIRPPFISHACATLSSLKAPDRASPAVGICSVIGFHDPSATTLAAKRDEALAALAAGATELDFVINYPLLLSPEPAYASVFAELDTLRQTVAQQDGRCVTKLILETAQLTSRLIVAECVLAWCAGFEFVKTSTGFNGRGASVDDVRWMRAAGDVLAERAEGGRTARMKVKASGGVRTWEDAQRVVDAGAERLGASAGVAIVSGIGDGVGAHGY